MHPLPSDLRKALNTSGKAKLAWADITPLARNEWICWVTSVKKAEMRGAPYQASYYRACGWQTPPVLLARVPAQEEE